MTLSLQSEAIECLGSLKHDAARTTAWTMSISLDSDGVGNTLRVLHGILFRAGGRLENSNLMTAGFPTKRPPAVILDTMVWRSLAVNPAYLSKIRQLKRLHTSNKI